LDVYRLLGRPRYPATNDRTVPLQPKYACRSTIATATEYFVAATAKQQSASNIFAFPIVSDATLAYYYRLASATNFPVTQAAATVASAAAASAAKSTTAAKRTATARITAARLHSDVFRGRIHTSLERLA